MRHQLQVPPRFLIFPLLRPQATTGLLAPTAGLLRPPPLRPYIMAPSPVCFLSILAVSLGRKSSWETLNPDFQQVLDDSAWSHHNYTGDSRHTLSSKPQSLSPEDRLLPSSTWLVRGPRDPRHFLSFSNTSFCSPCRLGWVWSQLTCIFLSLNLWRDPRVWWSHTQPSPPTVPPVLAGAVAGRPSGRLVLWA